MRFITANCNEGKVKPLWMLSIFMYETKLLAIEWLAHTYAMSLSVNVLLYWMLYLFKCLDFRLIILVIKIISTDFES